MRKLARASWIVAAALVACGEKEKDPGAVNDADLDRLRVQDIPCAPGALPDGLIHICGLSEVVTKNTAVHVRNATQGPEASALSGGDGSFDVPIAGGLDHVYEVRSEGAKEMPVVRTADGSVVRGYGVGFVDASGCELEGWNGVIRDLGDDARARCAVLGTFEDANEVVRGGVEPFVLRHDTSLAVMLSLESVGGAPLSFEITFADDVDSFTVPVLPQSPDNQFGVTELVMGSVSAELPGRTVETIELRAPAGSALVVADLTFARLDVPEL